MEKSLLFKCDESLFNIDEWHLIRCTKDKGAGVVAIVHLMRHDENEEQGHYMGPQQILKGECDMCYRSIPKDLVGIWTLYNFDKISEVK